MATEINKNKKWDNQSEIKKRKELLLLKTKELEHDKTNNKHLEGVAKEYKKYYDTVIKEKQQQYDSMMLLKEYLDDLIKQENIDKHQLKRVRKDQQDIILEMDKITSDLKDIKK